jgi:hypothetical protein
VQSFAFPFLLAYYLGINGGKVAIKVGNAIQSYKENMKQKKELEGREMKELEGREMKELQDEKRIRKNLHIMYNKLEKCIKLKIDTEEMYNNKIEEIKTLLLKLEEEEKKHPINERGNHVLESAENIIKIRKNAILGIDESRQIFAELVKVYKEIDKINKYLAEHTYNGAITFEKLEEIYTSNVSN